MLDPPEAAMKWHRTCAAVVITSCSLVSFAAEPLVSPTTAPATQPTTTATAPSSDPSSATSLEQATGRFESTLRRAREQYLRDLTELKRRALKGDNLAAANELNALIEQLGSGGGGASRTGRVTRFTVRANDDWQRSPVLVKAGDVLNVTVHGTWTTNVAAPALTTYFPDGTRPNGSAEAHAMWSILWARVGERLYYVGRGNRIPVREDGVLEFRSNDFNLGDNQGELTVQVSKILEP
jgi:hypothetical protein